MTKIGTLVRCDNCGEEWISKGPPPKEAYESQRVHVKGMSILLPEKVVKLHHKEGYADNHALFIDDKDFCDIVCLFIYVHKYMRGE